MLEDPHIRGLGHRAFERQAASLQEAVEAHHTEADRTFSAGAVFRARHLGFRTCDKILEDVVEHAHHICDNLLFPVALLPVLESECTQAAPGGSDIAEVIGGGGEGCFWRGGGGWQLP